MSLDAGFNLAAGQSVGRNVNDIITTLVDFGEYVNVQGTIGGTIKKETLKFKEPSKRFTLCHQAGNKHLTKHIERP